MIPRDVVLIVPTNSSGTADGVARAPGVLRQRGLAAALAGRPGFTGAGDLALAAPRPRRATTELAAVDYPQPGGLTWHLTQAITTAAEPGA